MLSSDLQDLAERYRTDGFVFLPELLPGNLLAELRRNLPSVLKEAGPQRFLEQDGVTVRAVYGLHKRDGVWREVSEEPTLTEIAHTLLGEAIYVYQWKINPKSPRTGDEWAWHRDYAYWKIEDGMPTPHAVTAGILLDDVSEENGPLQLVPASHLIGPLPEELEHEAHSQTALRESNNWAQVVSKSLAYTVSSESVEALSRQHGLFSACGPAGSTVFFHSNIIHGSAPNRSSSPRTLALITYNSISNAPKHWSNPRPDFFINHNPKPLSQL